MTDIALKEGMTPAEWGENVVALDDGRKSLDEQLVDAQQALESTDEYKKVDKLKNDLQHADEALTAAKERMLERMIDEDIDEIAVGEKVVGTIDRPAPLNIVDESVMEAWLKKNRKHSEFFTMVPKLDKNALKKYVNGLADDRKLPKVEECGVEAGYKTHLSIKDA